MHPKQQCNTGLLHNTNAAAAALDDAAEHNLSAAAAIRDAIARCTESHRRRKLTALAVRIENLSQSLSLWANVISGTTTPIARGDGVAEMLPRLLQFSRDVSQKLSAHMQELTEQKNALATGRKCA